MLSGIFGKFCVYERKQYKRSVLKAKLCYNDVIFRGKDGDRKALLSFAVDSLTPHFFFFG